MYIDLQFAGESTQKTMAPMVLSRQILFGKIQLDEGCQLCGVGQPRNALKINDFQSLAKFCLSKFLIRVV